MSDVYVSRPSDYSVEIAQMSKGEYLDLTSDPALPRVAASTEGQGSRSFVGIQFACCDIYSRVYINREQSAYLGNCPRCGRKIRIDVGPGGTSSRFFAAF